jgi:ABC-2 type transport system ATP-binding protein
VSAQAILVEGVIKRYREVLALDRIDFEVPAGTIFGLLGPNGAGKTTIVRILATVLSLDAGRAEVMGFNVGREASRVRAQIGLAGQNAAVDPNLTGEENLTLIGRLAQLPWRNAGVRAAELLERFSLSDAGRRPVRTYSGGMRRRLDVAAALVQRPPVLFLDEPTTGLDIQSRTDLWGLIRELVDEGATVLLTTQYLEEADRLADRVAVVDHGRVVANDTPAALKNRLGGVVIELGMANDAAAREARALLRACGPQVEAEGLRLRLSSSGDPRFLLDILQTLEQASLMPASVTTRQPSLDDVFLALTGHVAQTEAEPAWAAAGERRNAE